MAGGIVDAGNARDAARRDSWAAAYGGLRALDAAQMAPPDLEALADTAWWLSRRTSRSPPGGGPTPTTRPPGSTRGPAFLRRSPASQEGPTCHDQRPDCH